MTIKSTIILLLLIIVCISGVNAAAPVASFTSNVTTGNMYPLVVRFNDTSTNAPTMWNWSFGDGRWFNTTDSTMKNTSYQYAVAGKYTVNLTVSNVDGSNTKSTTDYINLTSDRDDNLTSWLHMNGTNGSTIFSGEEGTAWTTNGNAYISTNRYKYGGGSGAFSGTTGYISTPSSSAFNFGTNNFTIEFWINITSIGSTNDHIISKSNNPRTQGWGLDCSGGNDSGWDFWMGNDSRGQVFFNAPIPNKTWTYITIERLSGTIYLYINGNLTNSSAGFNANYNTTDPVWIGRQQNQYLNAFIDEFRISNGVARWKSNFTPPYDQYKGTLETNYPDINPNSTFRYKTNPTGSAYIDNLTQRNRTVQVQNITNTTYITGSAIFSPLYGFVKSVQLNTSYFSTGMSLVSSNVDNTLGLVEFNVTRPAGFNAGTDRASIIDYTMVYWNYSDEPTGSLIQYFSYGFLVNGTTSQHYPVHNFLGTPVTYGSWNFTADFTADNLTPPTGSTGLVTFTSTFTGSYPNRWNWSFGDGEYNSGTNSTIVHRYNTGGLKTVTLTEYLWQNGSINSTISRTNYINVIDTLPVSDFTSTANGSISPVSVYFVDTSTNYPTAWEWNFGDDNTSDVQNPTHIYTVCGDFTVGLRAWNTAGWSEWTNKTNLINVSGCTIPTPTTSPSPGASEKISTKVDDTHNLIVIGVIVIIVAGLLTYATGLILRKH